MRRSHSSNAGLSAAPDPGAKAEDWGRAHARRPAVRASWPGARGGEPCDSVDVRGAASFHTAVSPLTEERRGETAGLEIYCCLHRDLPRDPIMRVSAGGVQGLLTLLPLDVGLRTATSDPRCIVWGEVRIVAERTANPSRREGTSPKWPSSEKRRTAGPTAGILVLRGEPEGSRLFQGPSLAPAVSPAPPRRDGSWDQGETDTSKRARPNSDGSQQADDRLGK